MAENATERDAEAHSKQKFSKYVRDPADIQKLTPSQKKIAGTVLLGIAACAIISIGNSSQSAKHAGSVTSCDVTYGTFQRLRTGMTYKDVVSILGCPGKELSRMDLDGLSTVMLEWEGSQTFGSLDVTFQNGRMMHKTQSGL